MITSGRFHDERLLRDVRPSGSSAQWNAFCSSVGARASDWSAPAGVLADVVAGVSTILATHAGWAE